MRLRALVLGWGGGLGRRARTGQRERNTPHLLGVLCVHATPSAQGRLSPRHVLRLQVPTPPLSPARALGSGGSFALSSAADGSAIVSPYSTASRDTFAHAANLTGSVTMEGEGVGVCRTAPGVGALRRSGRVWSLLRDDRETPSGPAPGDVPQKEIRSPPVKQGVAQNDDGRHPRGSLWPPSQQKNVS